MSASSSSTSSSSAHTTSTSSALARLQGFLASNPMPPAKQASSAGSSALTASIFSSDSSMQAATGRAASREDVASQRLEALLKELMHQIITQSAAHLAEVALLKRQVEQNARQISLQERQISLQESELKTLRQELDDTRERCAQQEAYSATHLHTIPVPNGHQFTSLPTPLGAYPHDWASSGFISTTPKIALSFLRTQSLIADIEKQIKAAQAWTGVHTVRR